MKDIPQIRKSVQILSRALAWCGQGCAILGPAGSRQVPEVIASDRIQRILVIQLFALGDVLLSLPLLKGLRSLYPHGEIDLWVARNLQKEIAQLLPYVSRTLATDSRSIRKALSTIRELRQKRYDMAFVLYPVVIGSWLAWLTGARYRIGYTQDCDNTDTLGGADSFLLTHPVELSGTMVHDTRRYLDLGRFIGLPLTWDSPFLYPPASMSAFTQHFLRQQCSGQARPLVGMNPNASWPGKRWPAAKFARLADLLMQNQKVQVLFFGSKPEREYVGEIISSMRNKPLCAAGQTTLTQMAALIRQCHLFISNDTGPMHMACALDVPTLGIMGPTKIEMFRPWASHSRIVRGCVPCAPCQQENKDLCQHFSCISSISVDSVYEAAVEMIHLCS